MQLDDRKAWRTRKLFDQSKRGIRRSIKRSVKEIVTDTFSCSTYLLTWRDRFTTNQAFLDARSTRFTCHNVTARLEDGVSFLFRTQKAFIVDVGNFELRWLRLLLVFIVHDVADILVVHRCCFDVFGMLFVIAFNEYFTQIGVTRKKVNDQEIAQLQSHMKHLRTKIQRRLKLSILNGQVSSVGCEETSDRCWSFLVSVLRKEKRSLSKRLQKKI